MSILRVPVNPSDHIQGPDNAPVTLLEYGDYECPHCGAAHPVVQRVQRYFSSRLRLAYRHFPLLADFHPKGAAAQKYGAYREQDGVCERALFVIDRKGVIFWSYLSPIAVNPGADGILDALESLQNQEK